MTTLIGLIAATSGMTAEVARRRPLEHYPTADHQVGERPGCTMVLHGRAPSDVEGATALVQLFGLKGWTISPIGAASEAAFNQAANAWLATHKPPGK